MAQTMNEKLEHLRWAVESRAKNQTCALRLLTIFRQHEARWKTKKWSGAAQDLLSVSFSLWRAAFLADKTGRRAEVFADATEFLEYVIEDNAISYPQDKRSREWTFNYYTKNARAALETLHRVWPGLSPKYVVKMRAPLERWEYCQELLENSVAAFENRMLKEDATRGATQRAGEVRRPAREKK